MQFIDLQQAIARLATDPRIEPSTPIELETEHEIVHYRDRESGTRDVEHCVESTTAVSLAIHSCAGHRAIVLSSLPRPDALVR